MELPLGILPKIFRINPGLVIHAGANLCQERFEYDKAGFGPIVWIEALESISSEARILLKNLENQFVIQAALWDSSGVDIPFNVASNKGESSSVFKFKWHQTLHPYITTESTLILKSQTLDDVIDAHFKEKIATVSLLVLDLQGAEYEVLAGANKILEVTQAIHIEVSRVQLYKGQKLIYSIDNLLGDLGFRLVAHDLTKKRYSGDALYIRSNLVEDFLCMSLPRRPIFPYLTFKNSLRFLLVRIGISPKLTQSFINKFSKFW